MEDNNPENVSTTEEIAKNDNETKVDEKRKGNKDKKTKKKSSLLDKIISIIILIVCICGLAYSGNKLYHWVLNN